MTLSARFLPRLAERIDELEENEMVLHLRKGGWFTISECVEFCKEYHDEYEKFGEENGWEVAREKYLYPMFDEKNNLMLIKGKTKNKKKYHKYNVIFGKKDTHYDYSF